MIKIMIADDQQLIRNSLKIILDANPNFKVISTVSNRQEVLDSIKKRKARYYFNGYSNAQDGWYRLY